MKKIICLFISLICIIGFYDKDLYSEEENTVENVAPREKYASVSSTKRDYASYLEYFSDMARPATGKSIRGADFVKSLSSNDNVVDGDNVKTTEDSYTVWDLRKGNVLEKGLYNIYIEYFPTIENGKSSAIERELRIDGELPFNEAENFVFPRIWGNKQDDILKDKLGNEKRPTQEEKPSWQKIALMDNLGYVTEPYLFYFSPDMFFLKLIAIKEPMEIKEISIVPYEKEMTYAKYKEANANKVSTSENSFIRIEGQDAKYRSSPTLFPITDRSSPITSPKVTSITKLNAIGGTNWKVPGDWISWEFEVEEAGFYNFAIRAKQSEVRGMFSSRKVMINGELLFEEMANFKFKYKNKWQLPTFGNSEEKYKIYLEKGINTVTLEITFGDFGLIIKDIEKTINELTGVYRDIIKLTSTSPDPNRDYELVNKVPSLVERLTECRDRLRFISKEFERLSGERSDKTGIIDTMAKQCDSFIAKPRVISGRLKSFSDNIASLGTVLLLCRELPLTIDYLAFYGDNVKLPKANGNFFQNTWYSITKFFNSFFVDYNSIGSTGDKKDKKVEVWLSMGRDQANILRQMIDEDFTPSKDIEINLKLINAGVLLSATLAGRGPDVALNIDGGTAVDYALRNASYDISGMAGFEEHMKNFTDSAILPFTYGNGCYGIPESQNFLMMFVRDDIFESNGWTAPKTWKELIELIPKLDRQSLKFYLPVNSVGETTLNPTFASMLYQNNGTFYQDDNKRSALDNNEALVAFEQWTELYTSYKFPLAADFVNRFRTGQMPIGIAYYSAYNTLSVFAPELRGKWSFQPIPGTEKIDEKGNSYIDFTGHSSSTGVMMLKDADDKDSSWEFMKWWTSTDTQVRYGREMEAVIGAAARWTTANIYAMERLAWTSKNFEALRLQQNNLKAMPNVPGGYISGRELENSFRYVINNNVNPRETLEDYVKIMNLEINRKRREFGLPLYGV